MPTARPWVPGIREADEEDPADLGTAAAFEIACLWNDLDEARRHAIRGSWSIACDNIVTRIVILSRLSAPVPWGSIPTSLCADGTYQGIMRDAGIEVPDPDMAVIAAMEEGHKTGVYRL